MKDSAEVLDAHGRCSRSAAARLDAHDEHLGLDTRSASPALGGGAQAAGQLGMGDAAASGPQADWPCWYYGHPGQTVGPVNACEITRLIRQAIITRDTLLWSEDLVEWQPARRVERFAMFFA